MLVSRPNTMPHPNEFPHFLLPSQWEWQHPADRDPCLNGDREHICSIRVYDSCRPSLASCDQASCRRRRRHASGACRSCREQRVKCGCPLTRRLEDPDPHEASSPDFLEGVDEEGVWSVSDALNEGHIVLEDAGEGGEHGAPAFSVDALTDLDEHKERLPLLERVARLAGLSGTDPR